jgi:FkbM family methyltransferase
MKTLLQRGTALLADAAPVLAARTKRWIHHGPSFQQVGSLWKIEDSTGTIFVPYIRRYPMYAASVKHRIDFMLDRYRLGDLKDTLVIDIGAHIGEFAMAAAPLAKQIVCFEPDPVAREALLANTHMLANVQVMPIALSNHNKSTPFYVATAKADSSLFQPEKYTQVIDVEARRLDSLGIDTQGYARVVLKMDAEGFEPEVLEGGGDWLKHLDAASVDVAPERAGQSTYTAVKALLEAAGLSEIALTAAEVLIMRRAH